MSIVKFPHDIPPAAGSARAGFLARLSVLSLAALLLSAGAIRATEPQLPIQIIEDEKFRDRGWNLDLILDPKQVTRVQVLRQLYRDGKQLLEQRLSTENGRLNNETQRLLVPIPLLFDRIKTLEDGAYAQKIVVTGYWTSEPQNRQPVEDQRWIHFVIEKGHPRRVSLKEYSRIADRAEKDVGPEGKPVIVSPGAGEKEEIPADRTPRGKAQPLGRQGGLLLERPLKRPGNPTPEEIEFKLRLDKSEVGEN